MGGIEMVESGKDLWRVEGWVQWDLWYGGQCAMLCVEFISRRTSTAPSLNKAYVVYI
jgi:hypothetical protein